jgi:hypothetical protein
MENNSTPQYFENPRVTQFQQENYGTLSPVRQQITRNTQQFTEYQGSSQRRTQSNGSIIQPPSQRLQRPTIQNPNQNRQNFIQQPKIQNPNQQPKIQNPNQQPKIQNPNQHQQRTQNPNQQKHNKMQVFERMTFKQAQYSIVGLWILVLYILMSMYKAGVLYSPFSLFF